MLDSEERKKMDMKELVRMSLVIEEYENIKNYFSEALNSIKKI